MFRIFFIIIFILFSKVIFAEISLTIDDLEIPKFNILFQGCDDEGDKESQLIIKKIKKNLNSTDLFNIENSEKKEIYKIKDEVSNEEIILYNKYSEDGIDVLLHCRQSLDIGIDRSYIKINFKLWDVLDEEEFLSQNNIYSNNSSEIANLISDKIFTSIVREKKGHFNSKIAYVSESGNIRDRKKKIATINFDGTGLKYLTNGKNLALTPKFTNDPNKLMILLYYKNTPSLFTVNTELNTIQKLSSFNGTTMSASAHPSNPNLVIFSAINNNGNSDIYSVDQITAINKRLTFSKSIEATASFSPDGKDIIFTSDRSGRQEIYQMDISGRNVKKISNNNGDYSKPAWSPDGSLIAFTKIIKGKFVIGIMTSDGYNERILTSGYVAEGVSWSPNSRYLIYSKKNGPFGEASIPKLYVIDVVTGYEKKFPTPANEGATDPDWIGLD
ncbi:MAG: TolB protein [Rickettsiales bacterium]|jgi:TolB protein